MLKKLVEIKSDIGIIHPASKTKLTIKQIIALLIRKDARSLDFLQVTCPDNNVLGHFVGFLFYPHANLVETLATNFTQLPKALKTSILIIAAEYGFKPAININKLRKSKNK